MRFLFFPAATALLAVSISTVMASQVCVQNTDRKDFLFVAEVRDGDRVISTLSPGETLCAEGPGQKGGVVSVFENRNEVEGCSRLVAAPGGKRVLQRYASFDRCAWDDNTK